jgi:hypothetical protein
MRAVPIGWALPHDHAERRQQVTIAMARATTPTCRTGAACVIAACASWALENASPYMLLAAVAEEACEAAQAVTTEMRLADDQATTIIGARWKIRPSRDRRPAAGG